MKIKVLLADDHQMTRSGLRALVEAMEGWEICGEATTGKEAVTLTAKLRPTIVVMDMTMPELNGLDATRQIKKDHPKTEVLIFTGQESEKLVREAFEAGARSYLLKTAGRDEIGKALQSLALHKPYFTSEVGEILFARMLQGQKETEEARLTPREREIIQMLAEGASNKEVGSKLGISIKTVETHRATIMKKLRFKAFSELVRYAIRNQIISA